MALAKHLPTIFLLASLFISLYVVDARESQFFSKVTNTNNNNNNVVTVQETQSTKKQETQVNNLNKQETQETQPTFIPNENGYGLYDHGTGQLPPEATTTTTTTQESLYSDPNSKFNNNMNKYNEKYNNNNYYEEQYNNNNNYEGQYNNNNYEGQYNNNNNNNNNYYKKDSYVTEAEEEQLSGSRLQQTDNYATMKGQNNYYTGGNRYSSNNGFKQEGMSDTRFLENGKYYHDVNNEEKYYPQYNQATKVDTTYQYQNRGNFGNRNNVNEYSNYANDMNYNKNNYNNNGYYQNNNEEEFQETQNEFEPWKSSLIWKTEKKQIKAMKLWFNF